MKIGNLPTYEEYLNKYRKYKSLGIYKYYDFCETADRTIKILMKKNLINDITDNDEVMTLVYEIYNSTRINKNFY
jgi:hypothetical protein